MDMNTALVELLDAIREDYASWTGVGRRDLNDINRKMIAEFNDSLSIQAGRKYIKIVQRGSVWGFIVADDSDKKFKKGDILKAAGWATPARNSARGNILEGGYTIQWTGPLYLK
jgi:hypothetical protein